MPDLSLSNRNGKFLVLLLLEISGFSAQQFKAPPEVRETSGRRRVIPVGQEQVKLQCNVKNAQLYTWYKNGVRIREPFPARYSVRMFRYLKITFVEKSDSGMFLCVTSNNAGSTNYTVELLIEDPTVSPTNITEKIFSEPQIYFIWHQDRPVYVGEDVEIYCKVLTKDPKTKYRWYYSDSGVPDEDNLGSLIDMSRYKQPPYVVEDELAMGKTRFTLKLENLTIEQSGHYGCQVENVVGNGSRQTTLTVTHWPVIPVTTVTTEPTVSPTNITGDAKEKNGGGNEKRENEQSWISSIQYPGAVIGMLVAALFIFILVAAWSCWQRKKSRASRARGRPDIDSIHPRYQVKNEYVVLPDFNRG